MNKYNYFIEGIPGSGKTTLLNTMADNKTDYTVYREGDISPVELAWCAYMTKEQYENAVAGFPDMEEQIKTNTVMEHNHYITAYTRIRTQRYEFYQYMEQYEIYSGRKTLEDFTDIVFTRYKNYTSEGSIFECSFLQNIVDELMLYQMLSEDEIIDFYKRLIMRIDLKAFRLIRLVTADITESIMQIKKERVDESGNERWYSDMMNYLKNSPYGRKHSFESFDDLVYYFNKRIQMENKIIQIIPAECYTELHSRMYNLDEIKDY